MLKDKKIFERPFNDIVFEFFQTKDRECIYSIGYPGGINFEFYPYRNTLNVLFPFPTFEELSDLGIKFYSEHAYGISWQEIDCSAYVRGLEVDKYVHESLIKYFISELQTKEGLSSYMFNYFSHDELFVKLSKEKTQILDEFFHKFLKKVGLPRHFDEYGGAEDFDGIAYCNWTVKEKFNKSGYLDILVSIKLPKYHNEICKILCSKHAEYSIDELFGHCNGIDGRFDDSRHYGVYCNINFSKDYIQFAPNEKVDEVQFPWTRLGIAN